MGTEKDLRIENSSTECFSLAVEEEPTRWVAIEMEMIVSLKEAALLLGFTYLLKTQLLKTTKSASMCIINL